MTPILKLEVAPLKIYNFKFQWSIVFRQTKINQGSYYSLIQRFETDFLLMFSVESQPQNSELKNNPENFQRCEYHQFNRVRCTINRSHSTPCEKAEFEHLQIFPGHCLDLFSVCEWQDLSFTYQKSEKTTYLDNLVFSAFSVLWGTVKKSGLKSDPRQTLPGECAGESVTK